MSTRPCPHAEWIAQPTRNRYLYHCRECTVIISHHIGAGDWHVSRDPDRVEETDEAERRFAFEKLDRWMTEREIIYGHDIFVHPTPDLRGAPTG